jgi:replicative DNA helicase Mcm
MHCDTLTFVENTDKYALKSPYVCRNCSRGGPNTFKLEEGKSVFTNMQRAKMQELVEKLSGATPAQQITLWMEDDLVNRITPGEKIIITGVLRLRPVKEGKTRTSVYDKFLDVVHIYKLEQEFETLSISKEDQEEILRLSQDPRLFESIVKSVAPSIFGFDEIKSAVALQLFGGTPGKIMPDGEAIRSDMHVLLIGDPGTAKSSILQYVSRLAPKCIVVSSKGASGVGLTAAAEKDEVGEGWILKAGAMVLASGGQVNIDEFDKMNEEDRSAIHEAMEQQQISIAKAGIISTLPTKCAVLAAANPKLGRFDPNLPPASQFDIPPALLSRFDLIFTIKDTLDEAKDKRMAEHILLGHSYAAQSRGMKPEDMKGEEKIIPVISGDILRKYIAYARRSVFPVLSPEAADKIKGYYLDLRRQGKMQNTFPITPRQIEGIIRLAESSAKLRLSHKVELFDAERAIALVDFVLRDVFVDKETGRIDSDIINIGQPKSKVDSVRTILGVIDMLQKTTDLVETDQLVREMANYGMDAIRAQKLVDELMRQGDLYSPKPGTVKMSKGKQW